MWFAWQRFVEEEGATGVVVAGLFGLIVLIPMICLVSKLPEIFRLVVENFREIVIGLLVAVPLFAGSLAGLLVLNHFYPKLWIQVSVACIIGTGHIILYLFAKACLKDIYGSRPRGCRDIRDYEHPANPVNLSHRHK